MIYAILTSAYGRVYATKEMALRDFHAGKDFTLRNIGCGGTYCSKRELKQYGFTRVQLRYGLGQHLACTIDLTQEEIEHARPGGISSQDS